MKAKTKLIRQTDCVIAKMNEALKIRHPLQSDNVNSKSMALSPDGSTLATLSSGGVVKLWDMQTGQLSEEIEYQESVICVAWSPDGRMLAVGGGRNDDKVYIWNTVSRSKWKILEGHFGQINCLAWSPDGIVLASCSDDETIKLWDVCNEHEIKEIKSYNNTIQGITWSPDCINFCTCSMSGGKARVWDANTGEIVFDIKEYNISVQKFAWSPNGRYIVSGSNDKTIRIWQSKTGQKQYELEGHTSSVVSVSFLANGNLLVSQGRNGEIIFWQTSTWSKVLQRNDICADSLTGNIISHPTLPVMVIPSRTNDVIKIWDIDIELLCGIETSNSTIFYVNAKAILLGESGVGKSGLGIRIAEKDFRPTESTHGARFWHLSTDKLPQLPSNVKAELTLWDLAGQPEYRLTHQLFLDDTDAALLLFDCSDVSDPFRGVPFWAKVLRKHAPLHSKKYLVSARCDVSPITVHDREINKALSTYGLDKYFQTCAKTGEGVENLFKCLLNDIPWGKLPRTSTPELFQMVREYLLKQKQAGITLLSIDSIRFEIATRFSSHVTGKDEFDTIIHLLQSRGIIYRLEPRQDFTWVLLKPELINQYGASIIKAARIHPLGIGAVVERDVLTSNIDLAGVDRLPHSEETLVIEGTVELLIRHDLGFREMGYLVFPSQINVGRYAFDNTHPRTEVSYHFSGSIETIYASLVVRLSYTDYFLREDQWKYAVEFSRNNVRLGFSMRQIEEGTGELEIYFHTGISVFDRVTFIRFITAHLRNKGVDIKEHIRLYCPNCNREVTNREAIEIRIQNGMLDIPCQFCPAMIVIPKSVDEIYHRDPQLGKKHKQLTQIVEQRTEAEVLQFKVDKLQYINGISSISNYSISNKIFISYSKKDKQYFDEFKSMLLPAIMNDNVVVWDDTMIMPGSKWKEQIKRAIASSDIALLLVSNNFLASDFITKYELPSILENAKKEVDKIYWVCLSPCLFEQTEIVHYQAAHDVKRPLDSMKKADRLAAIKNICSMFLEDKEVATETNVKQLQASSNKDSILKNQLIHILHISDFHFENDSIASNCLKQLETDLIIKLSINKLEYLVISGDFTFNASEAEYIAAFRMVDRLVKRFGLDASRVVIVPGNHDINWNLSEDAYKFTPNRKLSTPLSYDNVIPAGDTGALLRDDQLYRERFYNFNAHFFRRIYNGLNFSSEYSNQIVFIANPKDRILFIGLNSSWQLDHHFRNRIGININALTQALDQIKGPKYTGWLKIAIWHHPVIVNETINNECMQLLTDNDFHICLHGCPISNI